MYDPETVPLALMEDERGASTAEYAIVTMAAVAIAGVLVAIMRSGQVQSLLNNIVQNALQVP
ncbi:DUF4244 domain-containing protein [Microbacterium amylolyticum]|uniref:Flp pilus assembly pilin Flp n=1 Tax=Microbacterium amylolyticum TaxID=936337 RepID=A0ABS4ZJM4_9MICO|nr:DUF4244 domain-containing protein [Microbacterium amylolyticum]MBP2437480.1 Flp pilus assembly pilin Flp [Microbacterium amylolyticum]